MLDPLSLTLQMPVLALDIPCFFERPWGPIARPDLALSRALSVLLKRTLSLRGDEGAWLASPRSSLRDHPSPVQFRPLLEHAPGERDQSTAFRLKLVLWGDSATRGLLCVLSALEEAARLGVRDSSGEARFSLDQPVIEFAGTLKTALDALQPASHARLELCFSSPCDAPALRALLGAPASTDDVRLALAQVAGNAANELCWWAIEEADLASPLDRRGCSSLADRAREQIEALVAQSVPLDWRLSAVDLGMRRSGSNGGEFPVSGVEGAILLRPAPQALPWLSLLVLRGAGGRRSLGLGRVVLSTPP